MAKPVTLIKSGRRWETQDSAKKHFVSLLNSYKRGQTVPQGSDHNDLLALLEIYDLSGAKRGSGVASFYLDAAPSEHQGNTSCFYVKRTDGSTEDFSVHQAVKFASQIQNQ